MFHFVTIVDISPVVGLKDEDIIANYYLAFPSITARLKATCFLPFLPRISLRKTKAYRVFSSNSTGEMTKKK